MPKPSIRVRKMLKDDEKILLSLSFNPSNYTPDVVMATTDEVTQAAYRYVNPIVFHDFHCTTYDFLYNMYQIGNIPNINSITERYILSSYNNSKDKFLGQIEWIGNYITSINTNGVVTNVQYQEFAVTGASGVYKNVHKVIIDFSLENSYNVYFVIRCE